jgi:transposase InsO family protein
MSFTMRYTAHPERQTAFTQEVERAGRIHALLPKASPWRNGMIERSNRTDNDECFHQLRFTSSEERRYQHRLWEMSYNCQRPHQGLGNKTPLQVYKEQYPLHARSRMLM